MDIKQITEEAEKLMTEHMQDAINAQEQWGKEIYYNWAFGVLNLWRRLASVLIQAESDNKVRDEKVKYRDDALEKFEKLVSLDRI
ncbi:hypothetical protein CJP72_09220 [Citrobacter sp. NCU1]|uniref:hypothetical protein n=1 Tax=Citrobacter sp. NCU1 TaxID=2026683 RepID=UPI00139171C2|nr:hypothetical protein [Citrobacter sp. NCU1]NDO80941.1 hypothetical protein [Citrobacter sp. NCU1]